MGKYKLSKLISLFRKFGGFRLVRAYVHLGLFGTIIKECLVGLAKRKTADVIYYAYQPKIIKALRKRYRPLMNERLALYESIPMSHERSNIIWFCWLHGIECAPPMIRICLESLKKHLPNKEIRIVDDCNRCQFVSFPSHIEKRWKKKHIPPAQFADLLRLELLIKYGGTWIDSSVLCTGSNFSPEIFETNLFFFQFRQKNDTRYAGISNWFITSCQNHPLLMTLRDMLYAYWKDYDCLLEYFVFHRFFDMIAVERPKEMSQIPYSYSLYSLSLARNWGKSFKLEKWNKVISETAFHKLTYKIEKNVVDDENNYYNYLIKEYGVNG